ncbi:hypothetical protein GYA13_03605 [Candidatus Kuenenbacteria bacterium]|nr:hypothetical protein [Candidatus Kuenenbacteria bacterium]
MRKFFRKNKRMILMATLFLIVAIFGWGEAALAVNMTCAKDYIALQVPIPGLGWCVKGFPEYLQAIYNLFVSISGILAVIMVMFGGFQWLLAGGNPTKISGAKATILSALAGLTLLLASYTILNIINPRLTNLSLGVKDTVVREVWVGGSTSFCSSNVEFTKKNNEKNPACGSIYELKTGGSCYGAWCEKGKVCVNRATSGVSASCMDEVTLEVPPGYGWEDTTGGSSGTWIPLAGSLNLADKFYCGKLYYWPSAISLFRGKKQIMGIYCENEESCVINPGGGIRFAKKKSDFSWLTFTGADQVGELNIRGCY